jgi:hypothetical protein
MDTDKLPFLSITSTVRRNARPRYFHLAEQRNTLSSDASQRTLLWRPRVHFSPYSLLSALRASAVARSLVSGSSSCRAAEAPASQTGQRHVHAERVRAQAAQRDVKLEPGRVNWLAARSTAARTSAAPRRTRCSSS